MAFAERLMQLTETDRTDRLATTKHLHFQKQVGGTITPQLLLFFNNADGIYRSCSEAYRMNDNSFVDLGNSAIHQTKKFLTELENNTNISNITDVTNLIDTLDKYYRNLINTVNTLNEIQRTIRRRTQQNNNRVEEKIAEAFALINNRPRTHETVRMVTMSLRNAQWGSADAYLKYIVRNIDSLFNILIDYHTHVCIWLIRRLISNKESDPFQLISNDD